MVQGQEGTVSQERSRTSPNTVPLEIEYSGRPLYPRRGNPSPGFSRLLAPTADLARRPSSGVGIDLRFCQTRPIAINQISARWLFAMCSQIATVIPAPTPAAGSAPCAVSETRRVSRAFCGQTSTHVDVPTARTTCAPTFSPSLAASVWRRARLLLHRLSNSLRSCSRLLIYRQQHLSNASGNFGRCPSGLVVHELLCACRCVIKARHACLSYVKHHARIGIRAI